MATKRRTVFWAMIASMTLGYMPWYNFSALIKYIARDFELTAGDTGAILAAFQLGYVIVVGVTGWLSDRVNLKKIVFWATLMTGISACLFPWLAQGRISIAILRLTTGLSAGAIYVPGMALLARWYGPAERGKALGAYTGALVAAYAGGYVAAAQLAASFGWRTGILLTSLPALAAALIVLVLVRDPGLAAEQGPDKEDDRPTRLQNRQGPLPAPEGGYGGAMVITVGYAGHMWELYAFWGWLGPFLTAAALARGMATAEAVNWAGAMAAGIILLGAPASWLWGRAADRMGRTGAVLAASMASALVEAVLGFLFGHSLALIVLAAGWIGFWVIADSAIFKAGLTEMVSPRLHGLTLGLQSVVGFGVTIVSPYVFGLLIESFNGPVEPAEALVWWPGFLMLGLGGLVAPVAMLILRRLKQARLMAGGLR